tara:strand:+ start:4313 stop:4729 length:417 start_codon:yes stop_codon:yes gene_type:complete
MALLSSGKTSVLTESLDPRRQDQRKPTWERPQRRQIELGSLLNRINSTERSRMPPVKTIPTQVIHLEREEITNLRNQCSKLEDIVTAQRIVILQLTENEDRLHQLLDIERRKTLSAELALQGEALTDIATSEPEGNPF